MLLAHPRFLGSSALLALSLSSVAQAQEAPPPAEVAPEAEAEAPAINFNLFADTYLSFNSAQSGSAPPYHRAYDNKTPHDPLARFPTDAAGAPAFGSRNGFGLSFVGLDASFDTGTVGATAFLRLGPSVPIFYGADMGVAGLDSFLGGYVTVKPVEGLVLDAGYFGTIYGAEVAESWINFNYTRGGLYYAMQPFYHFGIKAAYSITENVTVRAMAVNGANNIVDENDAPAFGLQLALSGIGDVLDLAIGGFYETGDDSAWGIETFADVVATLHLGDFTLLANFDYNINRATEGAAEYSYWGVMGTAAYSITPEVGVAVRGEYLADPDNGVWLAPEGVTFPEENNVITVTGTLDLKLLPHLFLRPEFRYETAANDLYFDGDGAPTGTWFTGVIGLVATTY